MKLSIIIPACKEMKINRFIQNLRQLDRINEVEIIVVDCSRDGETINRIEDARVTKITSKKGRANQQNAGARIAKGDILLFLHADTMLPRNAVDLIERAVGDPSVCAGAFTLRYDMNNILMSIIAFFENIRARISRVPYGDRAIFIRTSLFKKLGYFDSVPFLEDVLAMEKLKKSGCKIKILSGTVITSARRWKTDGIIKRTFKNRCILFGHMLGKSPQELLKWY